MAMPEKNPTSDKVISAEATKTIGPRAVPFLTVLLRTFGGLGGGIVGTGLILVIAFLGSGILSSAFGVEGGDVEVHPLFVFVFLAMIFVGSCAANVLGPLFVGLVDREKYTHLASSLYQIFIANVVMLVVVAPVYMVVASLKPELIGGVAALQVVVTAFVSAMILEIVASYRYALLGVYATAFSALIASGVYFFFYGVSSSSTPIILLFVALPVMWTSIALFGGLLEWVYAWFYKVYGVDFLSSVMKYGEDVRWISVEEEEKQELDQFKTALGKKEGGAEFLNRQK